MTIASPRGGAVPLDPASLEGEAATPAAHQFLEDGAGVPAFFHVPLSTDCCAVRAAAGVCAVAFVLCDLCCAAIALPQAGCRLQPHARPDTQSGARRRQPTSNQTAPQTATYTS